LRVEERELERLEVLVHPVAQVVLDAERDPAGHEPPGHAECEPEHPRHGHRDRERPQVGAVAADVVHGAADEIRDGHAHSHRGRRERERGDDPPAVRA
jgi:hypothetical protein